MPTTVEQVKTRIESCRRAIDAIEFLRGDSSVHVLLAAIRNRLSEILQEVNKESKPTEQVLEDRFREAGDFFSCLQRLITDGPTTPSSFLYKAYASNGAIKRLLFWSIVPTSLLLSYMVFLWSKANAAGAAAMDVLGLAAVMGAIGGYLNCLQSLGKYIGNRQLLRSWIPYYLLFPLKGAGLAVIVFIFATLHTFPNVHDRQTAPATPNPPQSVNTVSEPTSHPAAPSYFGVWNPYLEANELALYFALAGLVGLFSNQAVEMLAELFNVLFKRTAAKDSLKDNSDVFWDRNGMPPDNPPVTKQETVSQ